MDTVEFLMQLPRDLGETPEGEALSTNYGRFGPYIKYASKFVSINKEYQDKGIDPYNVTHEQAMELVTVKKEFDANKHIKDFPGTDIEVLNGRWGAYITDGLKNAKIPKDKEPSLLTQKECEELLAASKNFIKQKKKKKAAAKKKTAKKKTAKKKSVKKKTAKKKAVKKKIVKKKAAKKDE